MLKRRKKMSEYEIEPTCSTTEVRVGGSEHEVVAFEVASEADIEIENIYTVEAQINQWQLVNDMIYVVSEAGEIPNWLEIAIDEILNDPDGLLIDSLEELKALFDQFEEGYSSRLYSVESEIESQNTYVTALISRTDDNAAGIVRIDDTYASKDYAYAVSTEVVGAYLEDGELGGAWFERSVSAVADVAYSAARSASSLNASIRSNANSIAAVWGTLEDLSKQVDGQVTTWFVPENDPGNGTYYDPIGPVIREGQPNAGDVNPNGRPYWCWVAGNTCTDDEGNAYDDTTEDDTRAHHTGDTYVYFNYDAYGNKIILSTWRFFKDNDNEGKYNWAIFTDDLASAAYQAALDAQDTADGKVTTFFQTWAPTLADAGLVDGDAFKMSGDIWYNSAIIGYKSDDGQINSTETTEFYIPIYDGTMKRYNPSAVINVPIANQPNTEWHANKWVNVSDVRIEASVKRLDEATVNIDGSAVARSSLKVEATGSSGETAIAGYQASAESDGFGAQSKFRIFGDSFEIASTSESLPVFYVDNTKHKVGFAASVTFEGVPYLENMDEKIDDVAQDFNTFHAGYTTRDFFDEDEMKAELSRAVDGATYINGGWINTNTITAEHIYTTTLSSITANLGTINAGVMYNSGANSSNYTFMVNLDSGEIHIR